MKKESIAKITKCVVLTGLAIGTTGTAVLIRSEKRKADETLSEVTDYLEKFISANSKLIMDELKIDKLPLILSGVGTSNLLHTISDYSKHAIPDRKHGNYKTLYESDSESNIVIRIDNIIKSTSIFSSNRVASKLIICNIVRLHLDDIYNFDGSRENYRIYKSMAKRITQNIYNKCIK